MPALTREVSRHITEAGRIEHSRSTRNTNVYQGVLSKVSLKIPEVKEWRNCGFGRHVIERTHGRTGPVPVLQAIFFSEEYWIPGPIEIRTVIECNSCLYVRSTVASARILTTR